VAAAATIDRRPLMPTRTASRWALVGVGCLVLAVVSLLFGRQPTYDPTAWLIWGRQIVHGDLFTTFGPSWKPLPILVTAPAALLGNTAQQQIWLVVARAGALAALALTYRLAWRLEGPVAGVIAAVALLCSSGYATRTFRGDSEGLLVAIAFGAIEAHLCGRRWLTFGLVVAATLMRPELFVFAVGYGLWLVWAAPTDAPRRRTLAIVTAAGALVVAAWLIPEEIGSGELFRAASRALLPVAGSPATADFPFLATFTNAAAVLPWPLYAAGIWYVLAAIVALRRRRRMDGSAGLALALAGMATATMVLIALMAQAGFTGNIRYLTIPIGLTGIVGAAGLVRLARLAWARLGPRWGVVAIVLGAGVVAPFAAHAVVRTRDEVRSGQRETALYAALPDAIARAGGRAAVLRCGSPITLDLDTQTVVRDLGVRQVRGARFALVPGTVVVRRGSQLAGDPKFPHRLAITSRWVIAASCAP
jgi:hypothetical protein